MRYGDKDRSKYFSYVKYQNSRRCSILHTLASALQSTAQCPKHTHTQCKHTVFLPLPPPNSRALLHMQHQEETNPCCLVKAEGACVQHGVPLLKTILKDGGAKRFYTRHTAAYMHYPLRSLNLARFLSFVRGSSEEKAIEYDVRGKLTIYGDTYWCLLRMSFS